jgi:competence protein ComEA
VESFLISSRNRVLILFGFIGLILIAVGIFIYKSGLNFSGTKVEILSGPEQINNSENITAEISGAVITPGVFKIPDGSRIDDLLILAGGFSGKADRVWCDKYLNRAAKISDGQKVFIPFVDQQSNVLTAKERGGDQTTSTIFSSDSKTMININTSSLNQLDSLPGIGQVYGQSIIEHRPYSNVSELLSKGVLKASVYNKIKDLVTIY